MKIFYDDILEKIRDIESVTSDRDLIREISDAAKKSDTVYLLRQLKFFIEYSKQFYRQVKQLEKYIEDKNKEIELLKRNVKSVKVYPARRSDLDVEKIINLYMMGNSLSQIARILKCDKNTVKMRLIENGIQIRKKPVKINSPAS